MRTHTPSTSNSFVGLFFGGVGGQGESGVRRKKGQNKKEKYRGNLWKQFFSEDQK